MWTDPGMPQPELHRLARTRDGQRAAYPSWLHYREAIGKSAGSAKRFVLGGELRDSMRDTYQGERVGAIEYVATPHQSPYGPFGTTNAELARRLFANERSAPIDVSPAERADLEKRMAAVALARILVPEASSTPPGAGLLKGRRLF
jgi:hypothetical protein